MSNTNKQESDYSVAALLARGDYKCACGKMHRAIIKRAVIGAGVIAQLPAQIALEGHDNSKKVFVLADTNTWGAAGGKVAAALQGAGIAYTLYCLDGSVRLEPDEHLLGSIMLHWDLSCDLLVTVGTGVLNDMGKIVAGVARLPYIVVGTAPSMDGYASNTSSTIRDHLKVSVDSKCPDVVIGDTDVLTKAPDRMIQAGIGDMLAKFISVVEWHIGNIVAGEYYCPEVVAIMTTALHKIIDAAKGGLRTHETAAAVMEGMILSGIAVNYAGVSRPASGIEHYFSHIWDMRYVEFNTPCDLHGIQCGIGTVNALRIYELIKQMKPNREQALAYVKSFDYGAWCDVLRKNLGGSAEAMIHNEAREGKYDVTKHAARLESIIARWDEIMTVVNELPAAAEIEAFLKQVGAPVSPAEIGLSKAEERFAFLATKDVRDKYIASRLLWDIGELDNVADTLFPV